ncbi:hypothetical protein O181_058782 [Austropuccinia psidii MF-1]|uniref:Uncharacterized protein n=1 Tax=Austropuccinia psidii MF-1 TaxID=1389203 RepID=A0A9Q3EFE1_9BASI|nr:hypothetical protein [Austropuccinia psidii MF-1]
MYLTLGLIKSRSLQWEAETPPAQCDYHRHCEEEVSLLSPWRIHANTGDRQKEQPSSWFVLLLALPLNPTTPLGRHDRMKEEGPYSQRRDEVKICNYLLQYLESLEDSNDVWELREGILREDEIYGVLESPTRAAHDLEEEKSLLKEFEGS